MATMREVAAKAGVSNTTVSYVLNQRDSGRGISEATRQRVLEVARSLNFTPNPHAQSLSSGRANNTVGLFTLCFDLGVGTQKLQLIQSMLNRHDLDVPTYGLGLHNALDEEAQAAAIASIRRQKPRALVCFTQKLRDAALQELRRFQEEGGIVVAYDYPVDLDCDTVLFDREDNAYQAARHLLMLGHRRIGYADHSTAPLSSARVRGFRRAVEEFGGEWRDEWLLEGRNADDCAQAGQTLAKKYLELRERPSGLCIVNDSSALTFIAEVERLGEVRCPQQVSVVGHDDHPHSRYVTVPLTTVSHPCEEIAGHVTQFLLSRLSGEYTGPARHVTVRGELLARASAIAPF